jgi:hypothetical protein
LLLLSDLSIETPIYQNGGCRQAAYPGRLRPFFDAQQHAALHDENAGDAKTPPPKGEFAFTQAIGIKLVWKASDDFVFGPGG